VSLKAAAEKGEVIMLSNVFGGYYSAQEGTSTQKTITNL